MTKAPKNTALLAEKIAGAALHDFDQDTIHVAHQCILDWFAVTLAGTTEPCSEFLVDELGRSNEPGLPLIGRSETAGLFDAALINGTASHALDYDDVNNQMRGHPTVPVFPAVLALGARLRASGADILKAFIVGYEAECRIGSVVHPSHYANGYHATGTIGTYGAAAAAASLLGLDTRKTAHALGLAGAQAAGLKSMFGTMAKPFHAGKAAANGLLAARLAAHGFTANDAVLEAEQGLVDTQSDEDRTQPIDMDRFGTAVRKTLFKYHAACYVTHSTIEATRIFVERHKVNHHAIDAIDVHVNEAALKICNIHDPKTGLETKFSLRQVVAMVLAGLDTASLSTFSDENANDPVIAALRNKVTVVPDRVDDGPSRVDFKLASGEMVEIEENVAVPARDLDAQEEKLSGKFMALATPRIGEGAAADLRAEILNLKQAPSIDALLRLSCPQVTNQAALN